MSIFTFGLYQLYFFYTSWKYIDNERKNKISPSLKSIYYMFFNFSLVDNYLLLSKKTNKIYSLLIYLCVLINIFLNILSAQNEQLLVFCSLSCFFLIPFLQLRNSYLNKVESKLNKRKWLSKKDVKILGRFWVTMLVLVIFIIFYEGLE